MKFIHLLLSISLLWWIACQPQPLNGNQEEMTQPSPTHTNALIHETSPYLLQHAHNPVDWFPWGKVALEKAKNENKPLLISIGYSACHWCHVMERESFEDEEVARLMNENFICIKIDREERPDIDQVYMNAVQLMSGRGGWPLNCFATPDGRPFYGGTYFPKSNWMQILSELDRVYKTEPQRIDEYANKLTQGVRQSELIQLETSTAILPMDTLQAAVNKWKQLFDTKEGGYDRSPKFPLPNNYQFLLQYAYLSGDQSIHDQVELSLKKMAYGGIYDQIGGGFARYSTDDLWKVPHFEKMLYDNAQLVSLYADAYRYYQKPLYKRTIEETLSFIAREMTNEEGIFYSALDADSEGEEGKFYIWKKEELKALVGEDFPLLEAYYNVNGKGFWETGNYILLRDQDEEEIAKKFNLSLEELHLKVDQIKETLLKERSQRIRPGLDDKSLTSWNALMLTAYLDAYAAIGHPEYLEIALKNAHFITKTQMREDGGLYHNYKEGRSTLNGYLEDYSFSIEALIRLYELTLDEQWLHKAKSLADYCIQHFFDESSGLFFFTSDLDDALIARKTEASDNVIPASNSSMAKGLFLLGHYFDQEDYLQKSDQMLRNMFSHFQDYAGGYSNWGILWLYRLRPFHEIAIVGKDAVQEAQNIQKNYLPNSLVIGSQDEKSKLPLLEHKWVDGQTTFYVCENKVCQLPVNSLEKALAQLQSTAP